MSVLEIDHKELEPGVDLVTIAGRVMLGTESQKIEALVRELLARGRRKIVFDLAGVTHIDSTGIGRFIASLNAVMAARGAMCIVGAQGQVREGFRVTRLDTIFKFCETVDAARSVLG